MHEDSVQYPIDTPAGIAAWQATLPRRGALLHLGPKWHTFTLSMFHQLRCLDILREIITQFHVDDQTNTTYSQPGMASHCMNYLRQTVLCRADLTLESLWSDTSSKVTVSDVTHACKDWTVVYKAAEENYAEYVAHQNEM